MWPFETFTFDVDGSAVAFADVGRGPVLLFVHTGPWSFIWRDVLVRLSRDFRCICLDAPGTGRSARPTGSVRLEQSARAVTALIAHLELTELALVVHDLGGPAGVVGAARSTATVVGIAAINAFAWRPEGRALRTMLRLIGSGLIRELDVLTRAVPRITATRFGIGRHLSSVDRRAFLARLGPREIRAFHNYLADALRCEPLYAEASVALRGPAPQRENPAASHGTRRRTRSSRSPVSVRTTRAHDFAELPLLTIFGERNDPFHFQQRWRELFPGARQLVIPGGNHFPMCDDPPFVAEAIERWRRTSIAAATVRTSL